MQAIGCVWGTRQKLTEVLSCNFVCLLFVLLRNCMAILRFVQSCVFRNANGLCISKVFKSDGFKNKFMSGTYLYTHAVETLVMYKTFAC